LHAFNFDINNRAFSVTYLYLLIEFYNVFTVKIKYYVQKYAISRKNGCCNLALSVVSAAAKKEKKIKNGIKGNLKKLVQKIHISVFENILVTLTFANLCPIV
jgi:hypothetical protein